MSKQRRSLAVTLAVEFFQENNIEAGDCIVKNTDILPLLNNEHITYTPQQLGASLKSIGVLGLQTKEGTFYRLNKKVGDM